MLRNFLFSSLRYMSRSKILTTVIIIALSISFSSSILMTIFIHGKLNGESYLTDPDRIFLLGTKFQFTDQPTFSIPFSAPEVAEIIKKEDVFVEDTTRRIDEYNVQIRTATYLGSETISWVDHNFFDIFSLIKKQNSTERVVLGPDDAVISKAMALKIFGTENAVHQTFELRKNRIFRVISVFEDPPQSAHLSGKIYLSSSASDSLLAEADASNSKRQLDIAQTGTNFTYVMLRTSDYFPSLMKAIRASEELRSKYPEVMTVSLEPVAMSDLNLKMPGSSETGVILVSSISLVCAIVVLVSGINFAILMTARAGNRAREIGIRKVEGAARGHLLVQFLGESFIFVVLALILAFIFVALSASYWENLLRQSFDLSSNPFVISLIIIFSILFSVISGLYPSLILASVTPQSIFKSGIIKIGASKHVQNFLISMQFSLLIITLIGAITIARQVNYATQDVQHFKTDRTFVLNTNCIDSFLDEIRKLPNIDEIFCSSAAPLRQYSFDTANARKADGSILSISGISVSSSFFKFYNVNPIAGRSFDKQYKTDEIINSDTEVISPSSIGILINEDAMRRMGFSDPKSVIGYSLRNVVPNAPLTHVIGVLPNFLIGPVYERIKPLVFIVDPSKFTSLTIRLSDEKNPNSLLLIENLWKQYHPEKQFRPVFLDQHFQSVYRNIIIEMVVFKFATLVILVISLFGLLAISIFNIQSRLKEIGVRRSLGAHRSDIGKLLFIQLSKPIFWSSLIAWPIAYFGANYWLEGFAYHINLHIGFFMAATLLTLLSGCGVILPYVLKVSKFSSVELLRSD